MRLLFPAYPRASALPLVPVPIVGLASALFPTLAISWSSAFQFRQNGRTPELQPILLSLVPPAVPVAEPLPPRAKHLLFPTHLGWSGLPFLLFPTAVLVQESDSVLARRLFFPPPL